jgi:hypothetical protein
MWIVALTDRMKSIKTMKGILREPYQRHVCHMQLASHIVVTPTNMASNERVISEWRNLKKLEGSGGGLILRSYSGIHMEGLIKTMKDISQNSRSSDQYYNPGPRTQEGVFTTRPRRSVKPCR